MSSLYIGLVHYPVLNKHNETVQTSVTNLDIHDIARSASTFGVKRYFIITPDETQQEFVNKIISFWQAESGQTYNADRSKALSKITLTESIATSKKMITTQEGMQPIVITTTARQMNNQIDTEKLSQLYQANQPLLILFGTGHGLIETIHDEEDYILKPIEGIDGYNHLSVRSAVAIILDRITSAVYKGRN
jgi:hypothetical protein